jgi:hypothetical protein
VGCPPSTPCRPSWRPLRECRCCSTAACAAAPTWPKPWRWGQPPAAIGRPYAYALAVGGTDGVVSQLRSLLAELDLLMAIDGFPTIADLRSAGTRRL